MSHYQQVHAIMNNPRAYYALMQDIENSYDYMSSLRDELETITDLGEALGVIGMILSEQEAIQYLEELDAAIDRYYDFRSGMQPFWYEFAKLSH